MPESGSNKTIAKNTGFLYIRMIVVMAVTFFTSRIILRSLGETDYGVYNVVGGIVTIMSFLNGALGASTSRFLTYHLGKGDHEMLRKTFSAALNLHIIVALLVVILGETVGLWFFYTQLNIPDERMYAAFWVYQFSIVTTCINFIQVPYNASIISHENMSIYAYVGLYEACSKLGIAYLILISPIDKLIFYAALLMLNSAIIQLFYRYYTRRRYAECRFNLVRDKQLYKQLISYGGWDMFGNLAGVAQGQGINILLNIFFGPSVNAARAIAVQIQSAVTSFVQNVIVAFRPQVIKSYATGETDTMYNLTFRAAKLTYALMLLLTVPICFELDFILQIWLGDSTPQLTATFALIMLANIQLEVIHTAYLMSYHAIGRIKLGNSLCGSLMILSLPIGYVALKLGAPAEVTFIIILAVNFVCQIIGWIIIHGYVYFSYLELIKRVYLPCVLLTLISVIFPYLCVRLFDDSWIRLLFVLFVGDMIIILSAWNVILSKNERESILDIVKRRIYAKTNQ